MFGDAYTVMKRFSVMIVLLATLLSSVGSLMAGDGWMTSIPEALVQSKKTGKPLMVEFTGSDWCPPCIMMHKAVFSKEEFIKKASEKFILVKIDIPKSDEALTKKNQEVLKAYKVQGVPTVLLLDADNREFARIPASQFNTVESFLAELDRQLERKDMF